MTRATSHIEKAQVEDETANLVITNSMPKTVMGSGIAPPRLCKVRRPHFRNHSILEAMSARSQY
jgi:hypothetical protein